MVSISFQNWLVAISPSAADGSPGSTSSQEGLVDPEVMDTYVRSCAGYCVITYLLGVGDRHLENLLLTRQGSKDF